MGVQSIGRVSVGVTSSGRSFHVRAAATSKVRLPIVDSFNSDTTRRIVMAERRARRPGKSDTRTSGSRRAWGSPTKTHTPARRSYTECALEVGT
jgi:hypothetical protein